MAITRTAKGVAQSKENTSTLQISSVSLNAGDLLVVGISYENDFDISNIKWGKRPLKLIPGSESSQGDTILRVYRLKSRDTATRDLVATWAGNMNARVMIASSITEASLKDVISTASFPAGTIAPDTGTALTSTVNDTISIAFFASGGPSSDLQGVAGLGHTLGQREGTTGGGAATNVTIQETYEILTLTGDIKASLVVTTGRIWACVIVAFKSSQTYTVSRAEYHPYDGNPNAEVVVFVMKDESGDEKFQSHLPRADFEEMTDQEVTDYITASCHWWDSKTYHEAASPDFQPDSAFNTRVGSFVNDEIKL